MGKFIDLTNQKFERLTALHADGKTKDGRIKWLCKCECGKYVSVDGGSLRSGNTKSCGCYHIDKICGHKIAHIEGNRYGRLVVVSYYGYDNGCDKWKCKCDCGNETVVSRHALESGNTSSCGCYNKQRIRETHYKHGGYKDRLYGVWKDIKKRCYNENERSYKDYGGRGIKMCDEWRSDYHNFKSWAISTGYDENAGYMECTIDRVDVNGDYCPENCRWVDIKAQANNTRCNCVIEYNTEKHTLSEWANILGIKTITLWTRINKYNWPIEKAFTTPVRKMNYKEKTV